MRIGRGKPVANALLNLGCVNVPWVNRERLLNSLLGRAQIPRRLQCDGERGVARRFRQVPRRVQILQLWEPFLHITGIDLRFAQHCLEEDLVGKTPDRLLEMPDDWPTLMQAQRCETLDAMNPSPLLGRRTFACLGI